MRRQICFALGVFGVMPLFAVAAQHGEWTLNRSATPGRVQFSIVMSDESGQHQNSSSNWNAADFHGLDWSTPGKHDVHFTISRDAGEIECEGFLKDGEGAGLFAFVPNPQYASQMTALGIPGFNPERQFAFALHDVSLDFARQMKAADIEGLDAAKLIAFRIHGVSREFVNGIEALGYAHPNANELIAMRIHGVTPDYIQELRSRGVHNATLQQLIALRIHGIN